MSFSYTVVEGDADADGVAVPANGLEPNGGKFTNALGTRRRRRRSRTAVTKGSTIVDGVRPTVTTAQGYDTTLKVTFNETLGAAASLANSASR